MVGKRVAVAIQRVDPELARVTVWGRVKKFS
jgi:hypothetical protein